MDKYAASKDDFVLTQTDLKTFHDNYPKTKSIGIIKLTEAEQWKGPVGKLVTVGFFCLACDKKFKTCGKGSRSWKSCQEPGARAVYLHANGRKHETKHTRWQATPAKRKTVSVTV